MIPDSDTVFGFKLDGNNYPLWSKLMRVVIGSRGMSSHITGVPPPPTADDPMYSQWEQDDHALLFLLLQNMEMKLVTFCAYKPTSKALWDSLAVMYGDATGDDPYELYCLEVRASRIKQGQRTLKDYWNELQGIWMDIDRRQPIPLGCCENNCCAKLIENSRLYKFLAGLEDRYDGIRRDILKESPIPSPEAAFSMITRVTRHSGGEARARGRVSK